MTKKQKRVPPGMGEFSTIFIKTAIDMGIKFDVVSKPSLFTLQKGKKKAILLGMKTPLNNLTSSAIADNKYLTKKVWKKNNVKVPRDFILRKHDYKKIIRNKKLVFPVVTKPIADSLKGIGIRTNINSKKELEKIVNEYFLKNPGPLLVEEYYGKLEDYRILILKGKLLGVLKRIKPYVIGDGKNKIKDLLEKKNIKRKKEKKAIIKIDAELREKLKEQKLNLNSIPEKEERIELKNVCNAGQGGEVEEDTDKIHSANVDIAIKAAEAVKLDFAGIDVLCKDISKPLKSQRYVFIEINKEPDIALHHSPEFGKPNPVAIKILTEIFK